MPTLATPRTYAFHQKQPDSRWWSVGTSIALTTAIFAAALVSMRSGVPWISRATPVEPPEIIRFVPPPAVAPKAPRRQPPPVSPPETRPVPSAPTTVPTAVPNATPADLTQRADSTSAAGARSTPSDKAAPGAAAAPPATSVAPAIHGAPIAPVGVVGKRQTEMTPELRAATLKSSMNSLAEYVRTHPPTGQELADLQAGKRQAEMLARRVGTAGNSQDVHVMTGDARDGAGVASGGLGSIPFPFLEPGPSAAQRKRDEAIDADNRARFLRLQARVVAKRDSARADSLRRDSLARKGGVP